MSTYEQGLMLNKICVDSRFRSPSSKSDSDFTIELPETIMLPPGTKCYVTDVSIVHSWYSIERDTSDKLFFTYKKNDDTFNVIITLASQNYSLDSLADEIKNRFSQTLASSPAWVRNSFKPNVTAYGTLGIITIANSVFEDTGMFYIWSDEDLQKTSFHREWDGGYYNIFYPGTINKKIKNYKTQTNTAVNPFASGFVDLLTHHNIYIKSSQLGSFQNIGPNGERDILKKVLVAVPFGELIADFWINDQDFTDCSKLTLKTLHFRVTDVYNIPLNLNGHHVSFSLIFSSM